ncbi:uncharacterized protein [Euwallacea similis]|uniref:uncharacterized protein n=1 Tax=Euwallacea similis TaxID=1736056 RepID=UPI00344F4CA6
MALPPKRDVFMLKLIQMARFLHIVCLEQFIKDCVIPQSLVLILIFNCGSLNKQHYPEDQGTSVRRISAAVGISVPLVWKTHHEELLYPYHVQRVQVLNPLGHQARVLVERLSRFEQYLLDNTDAKETFACEIRLKNVEDDLREFDKVQTRLEFMDPNERQNRLETESIYYNVISEAKRFIKLAHASQNCGTASVGNLKPLGSLGKLPDLGLPSFFDSATNVRKFIDTVQQHKAALEKLKLPVVKWDALLNPIILSKLDERTNHDWERKQCHTESPTVNQLLDFLTDKCFALESSRGFSRPQPHRPDKDRNENRGLAENVHICNENHFVYQCPRFTQLSMSEKYNEIRKHKLCSNCLRVGFLNQECKSSGCKKCAKKHNTAFHYEKREVGEGVQNPKNDGNSAPPLLPIDKQTMNKGKYSESEQSTRLPNSQDQDDARPWVDYSLTLASASLERDQVLLSTANILIADEKGEWQRCNALLDSGSQSNLMSERLCRKLNLSFKRINMPLYGISQLVTEIHRQTQAKIKSRFNSFEANLTFLVFPTLTENLPLFKFSRAALKIPGQINLADEHFNEPKNIDILLGVDIFYDLLGSGKMKLGDKLPVFQETSLGWVISRNLAGFGSRNQKTVCNLSMNISNKMLNDSLTKFWHVEEFEHSKFLSKEESYCEEYFTQTTTRDKDNSFIVKYPFKIEKNLELGESKPIALSRLKNLERKLEKNEELKKQYVDFMNEYQTLGHMTRQGPIGNDDSMPNSSYFLPHRAVVKDSITTKCRVVFDTSCKTSSGVSLNDTLMVDPVVQDELYAILLRLRLRKIVLSANIKMMYRYIKIQDSEQDYQKILWRVNSRDPVSVYRLNTVTYGTSSAHFQATRYLVELARQNENTYTRTSEIMKHSFYMDDLLVSLNSEEEALNVYKELKKIMEQATFKLRKWAYNSGTVLRNILESNNNENSDSFTLPHNKQLKTLGISWDPQLDTLKYTVNVRFDSTHATKRTILATISQIFDPLGLIGPELIKAKLIIQELWRLQLDWDQEVPHDLRQRWEEFATQLTYLNECKVVRHVMLGNAIRIALYRFSDSSEKAYGACIYVGSVDDLGNHGVRLLTAQSRVASYHSRATTGTRDNQDAKC